MFYSLLLITTIIALFFAHKHWRSLPKSQQRQFRNKVILWGGATIALALVATGKTHWITGGIAALLVLVERFHKIAHYLPGLRRWFADEKNSAATDHQPSRTNMSTQEAAEILNVKATASPAEIKTAHKKLMQKLHPDRGGSEGLAKQLNSAKARLLNQHSKP